MPPTPADQTCPCCGQSLATAHSGLVECVGGPCDGDLLRLYDGTMDVLVDVAPSQPMYYYVRERRMNGVLRYVEPRARDTVILPPS